MTCLLVSCAPVSFKAQCPTLVQYPDADQKKIAEFIASSDNPKEVKKLVKDYYRLREACRSIE